MLVERFGRQRQAPIVFAIWSRFHTSVASVASILRGATLVSGRFHRRVEFYREWDPEARRKVGWNFQSVTTRKRALRRIQNPRSLLALGRRPLSPGRRGKYDSSREKLPGYF